VRGGEESVWKLPRSQKTPVSGSAKVRVKKADPVKTKYENVCRPQCNKTNLLCTSHKKKKKKEKKILGLTKLRRKKEKMEKNRVLRGG